MQHDIAMARYQGREMGYVPWMVADSPSPTRLCGDQTCLLNSVFTAFTKALVIFAWTHCSL